MGLFRKSQVEKIRNAANEMAKSNGKDPRAKAVLNAAIRNASGKEVKAAAAKINKDWGI